MIPLHKKILERAQLEPTSFWITKEQENARLLPIISSLLEANQRLVEALASIQSEIDRSKNQCIGCANGNDLEEYDICRCCWRVYINNQKYIIWDWIATEDKLKVLIANADLLEKIAGGGDE